MHDEKIFQKMQEELYEELEQELVDKYDEVSELQRKKHVAQIQASKLEYEKLRKQIKLNPSSFNPLQVARKVGDRKSVVQGKSVDLGGRRIIKKKRKKTKKKQKKHKKKQKQKNNT